MANVCQSSLFLDMAAKYGGELTCSGQPFLKSASPLPTFSYVETLLCNCKFGRNSMVRSSDIKHTVMQFSLSSSAQWVAMDPLNVGFWTELLKGKNSSVNVGKSKQRKFKWNSINGSYGGRSSDNEGGEGDLHTQEILVEMVNLEVSKVRLAESLDKSSQNLRNIVQQTQLEYDRLADRTLKRWDASQSRVLREFDANAIVFQRELNLANADLEEQSRNFEKFQLLAKYSQNDGLFFTSLYGAPRAIAYRSGSLAKENAVITSSISKEDLTRGYKQILYGGLSLVFVSFMWSSGSAFLSGTCMRASKLMSYGVIMSLLLMQLAYAKVLTGEADTAKEIDTAEEIEDAAD